MDGEEPLLADVVIGQERRLHRPQQQATGLELALDLLHAAPRELRELQVGLDLQVVALEHDDEGRSGQAHHQPEQRPDPRGKSQQHGLVGRSGFRHGSARASATVAAECESLLHRPSIP